MAQARTVSSFEEQAIEWMVVMHSGRSGDSERAAFAQWLSADPRHAQAWQRLGAALDTTLGAGQHRPRADTVDATLHKAAAQSGRRRRMLRGALAMGGVGMGSAWLAQSSGLLPDWRADLHTATGERRTVTLADGSRLDLDARTSVDIVFGPHQRLVHLRQGQLLAHVQSAAPQPFVVRCRDGQVQSTGQRFMLRQEDERTLALALDSDLLLATRASGAGETLRRGASAYLDGHSISAAASVAMPDAATAWVQGMLHAEDMPLGQVLAALKPYRLGFVRVSAAAARLRVTGVYGLDDSDATLQTLADTLPIEVRRYQGGWLVRVEMAG